MASTRQAVIDILERLKGSGRFATSGSRQFRHPGLAVKGVGELAFPVNDIQAKALLKVAHRAPFGKGMETVYDDKVRSAWEIEATELLFIGAGWAPQLGKILGSVREELGLEGRDISASLYKLLIYEPGDFFLPHRDTEKEKGMFGTLIIGLPSRHQGGELLVSFSGEQQSIEFGGDNNIDKLQYAAFYADCEHEVKPITNGYRVCLVYNMVQKSGMKATPDEATQAAVELAKIFSQEQWVDSEWPHVVLLGHQYTPENFSIDDLKLDDRAKGASLLYAAEKAGHYAKLCLVTSYQSGLPDDDGYYDYGEGGDEDATMMEVYDSSLDIEHWATSAVPALYRMQLNEDNLIHSFDINDGDPLEKESTGYMGNYGPDLMHWYHYGAVVIWSHKTNAQLLISQDSLSIIRWVEYFNNHPSAASAIERSSIRKMLRESMGVRHARREVENFNPVADWIITQKDYDFFHDMPLESLGDFVLRIESACWVRLAKFLKKEELVQIFDGIGRSTRLSILEKFTSILRNLYEQQVAEALVKSYIECLPDYIQSMLGDTQGTVAPATAIMLDNILYFAEHLKLPKDWPVDILARIGDLRNAAYRNEVIFPFLKLAPKKGGLFKSLYGMSIAYFQGLKEPRPPKDWVRELPQGVLPKKVFQLLHVFFQSPVDQYFDYRAVQAQRTELEFTLQAAKLEIRLETIRRGSPHTLRIIKTQAGYEKAHRQWELDRRQLRELETI